MMKKRWERKSSWKPFLTLLTVGFLFGYKMCYLLWKHLYCWSITAMLFLYYYYHIFLEEKKSQPPRYTFLFNFKADDFTPLKLTSKSLLIGRDLSEAPTTTHANTTRRWRRRRRRQETKEKFIVFSIARSFITTPALAHFRSLLDI